MKTGDEILNWAEGRSWQKAMSACSQDPEWHGEGDVWTHTRMVYNSLIADEDYKNLESESQSLLSYAAIFHDIGKPETSIKNDIGKISSFKHSQRGEKIARKILIQEEMDFSSREKICQLIRHHSYPFSIRFKDDPEAHTIWSSWLTDHKLLYILCKADALGRISTSASDLLSWLEYWKETAEKLSCFNSPYHFANEQARILFYRKKLNSLHYAPHEGNEFEVLMLSGLPGAGKSSWRTKNRPELPYVELDAIRSRLGIPATDNQGKVIQKATENCKEFLRKKQSFIFDATNITKQIRQRWLSLFFNYGARVKIIYIEKKLSVIKEQNQQRTNPVPENIIDKLVQRLEPPSWSEAHEIENYCIWE
jgi:putative nucleotidyltransferase with HDIG domain